MRRPELNDFQAIAIKSLISKSGLKGADLRSIMSEQGVKRSPSTFCVAMQKLEDLHYIKSKNVVTQIKGRNFREKFYTVTAKGAEEYEYARQYWTESVFGVVPKKII